MEMSNDLYKMARIEFPSPIDLDQAHGLLCTLVKDCGVKINYSEGEKGNIFYESGEVVNDSRSILLEGMITRTDPITSESFAFALDCEDCRAFSELQFVPIPGYELSDYEMSYKDSLKLWDDVRVVTERYLENV